MALTPARTATSRNVGLAGPLDPGWPDGGSARSLFLCDSGATAAVACAARHGLHRMQPSEAARCDGQRAGRPPATPSSGTTCGRSAVRNTVLAASPAHKSGPRPPAVVPRSDPRTPRWSRRRPAPWPRTVRARAPGSPPARGRRGPGRTGTRRSAPRAGHHHVPVRRWPVHRGRHPDRPARRGRTRRECLVATRCPPVAGRRTAADARCRPAVPAGHCRRVVPGRGRRCRRHCRA